MGGTRGLPLRRLCVGPLLALALGPRILPAEEPAGQPSLSGDGNRIVFASGPKGSRDIFVMARDGTHVVRLTDDPADDFSPAWCAGDSQIVFVSRRAGYSDLFIMRADGTRQRVLANTESARYEPAWSPAEPARNYAPRAWLAASSVGATRVRFALAGTWDREEGRRLSGTLSFGDGADTTFARVPDRVEHGYPREGIYNATLRVQDSGRQAAYVFLELTLRTDLRVHYWDITYEKEYSPTPLDR